MLLRRTLLIAAAAVFLGALSTVGVAWWAALHNAPVTIGAPINMTDTAGTKWFGHIWPGTLRDASNFWLQTQGGAAAGNAPAEFLAMVPHDAWRVALLDVRRLNTPTGFWNSQAYGWPRKSMAMGFYKFQGGQITWGRVDLSGGDALPLRPIVLGFAIDTAAFAPAWAIVLTAACLCGRRARAWWRRRRGACPTCAYDLAGLAVCPECGWNKAAVRNEPRP